LATATGVLITKFDIIRTRGDGTPNSCPDKTVVSNDCTGVINTSSTGLCANEPLSTLDYSKQSSLGTTGGCTAFMLRQDVFATAAHCIFRPSEQAEAAHLLEVPLGESTTNAL